MPQMTTAGEHGVGFSTYSLRSIRIDDARRSKHRRKPHNDEARSGVMAVTAVAFSRLIVMAR